MQIQASTVPLLVDGTAVAVDVSTTWLAAPSRLPLAIGASLATGKRTVIVQGDGGFMFNLGELATAVQEGVPVITCVFNDRGYGILRFLQDMMFEGRRAAVNLHTPDFAMLAQSTDSR